MKKVLLALLFCAPTLWAQNFKTISDLEAYTKEMPQYPDIDNEDWFNPDFSTFHIKHLPSVWQRWGLGKKGRWSAKTFKRQLKKIVKQRENKARMGHFIHAVVPHQGARFFIWGDLQGALHSLTRDLVELKKQKIIDDTFKLPNKDHYLVFNGDVIDRSPYILETLSVVMHLMQVNPDQVIYLRGNHEEKEYWHNYGLRRELEIRAHGATKEEIPLDTLVKRLFNTLPLALYIVPENIGKEIEVVRISHYGTESKVLKEKDFAGFLSDADLGDLELFKLVNKQPSEKPVDIKAIIKGESRTTTYRPTEGLARMEADKGAVAWTVLSAPTGTYRRLYEFFHDAFAVIDVKGKLDDWTLTLYNQDVREMLGFKQAQQFQLTSGLLLTQEKKIEALPDDVRTLKERLHECNQKVVELKAGIPQAAEKEDAEQVEQESAKSVAFAPGQEITFGTTIDLTKGAKILSERIKSGLYLSFDRANEKGGVKGKKLELIVLDDEYTPSKARENVERLVKEYKTNFVFSAVGSPTFEAYLDMVKDGSILALFPNTGGPIFREPDLKYVVHFRPSYFDEGKMLVEYALKKLRTSKVAFFYQNDAFGLGAFEGGKAALKEAGIEEFVDIPYERNDVNFATQAQKVKDGKPEAIFFFSTSIAAKGLIRQVGINAMVGKKLLGLSDLGEDVFKKFVREKGLSFVTANVVPNPQTSDLEIAKEYRRLAKEKDAPVDTFTFEAFIIAELLIEVLRKIEGPITKEAILNQIEQIKDYGFKGLYLSFNPQERDLSHTIWLDTGADKWIRRDQEKHVPKDVEKIIAKGEAERIAQEAEVAAKKPKKLAKVDHKDMISLGTTLDLSKGLSVPSRAFRDGFNLFFEQANQEGGIKGKPVNVIVLDDEYTPKKARANVEEFLSDGIDIMFGPLGSPTLEAYVDLVEEKKVLVLFPVTGSPLFRKADLKYMVHLRPSYYEEGRMLAKYAVEQLKANKVAFFYQEDAFGEGLLEGARAGMAGLGLLAGARTGMKELHKDKWIEVAYPRNNVRFVEQVKRIKEEKPDAICFLSTSIAARELIKQVSVATLAETKLLGMSDLSDQEFNLFIKSTGLHMITVNALPNPETSNLEIVKEYRELAKQKNVTLDIFGVEGYVCAKLFAYLANKIDGPITKDALVAQAEQIKNESFGGISLNFNPKTRELSNSLWINNGKPEWERHEIVPSFVK